MPASKMSEKFKVCGVYRLRCTKTKKIYIGASC